MHALSFYLDYTQNSANGNLGLNLQVVAAVTALELIVYVT